MRGYQQEVWDLIYSFEDFNIEYIPRCQKIAANILANSTSKYTPLDNGFSIETM
jgi:hypothetical protein